MQMLPFWRFARRQLGSSFLPLHWRNQCIREGEGEGEKGEEGPCKLTSDPDHVHAVLPRALEERNDDRGSHVRDPRGDRPNDRDIRLVGIFGQLRVVVLEHSER